MNLINLDKMIQRLVLVCALVFNCYANAIEVTDLYQATVPVDSQVNSERNKAIKNAMAAVMIKVGGQPSVLDNQLVKQGIAKFNQYLSKYQYERIEQQLFVVAEFNEDKINRLFQQANLPIWGRLRPQILVWLVEEDRFSRQVLAESSDSTLPKQIVEFSQVRGLPLVLPLMDLEDTVNVNITDLWGRFSAETQLYSQRYLVDASLIIRISRDNNDASHDESCEGILCEEVPETYSLDWSLIAERQQFGQVYQGNNQNELLANALDDVAEVIYQDYASSTDLTNELLIEVANVDSLKTYVDVQRFLSELSAVESVSLVSAEQERYTYKLSLLGSKKALLASLKLNDVLQQYVDPLAGAEPQLYPVFYWRGK
ncbi:DUF2066 domain-containing protein [Thalassotalea euphylliae]|uniref:DUF2066 domain-containing protein n=1 Tax=Thalassotalea euphylliae TaxID=1655234 RepID=UPI003632CF24